MSHEIFGVKIYIEDHKLTVERFIIPKLFKKRINCSDIKSLELELGMGRIMGSSGRSQRESPVLSLVVYLNGGKRILLAQCYSEKPYLYESIVWEIQKEIKMDNMRFGAYHDQIV